MAVVYQTGVLFQFDATGAHQIATGVTAAGVGFAPSANDLTFGTLPSIEALDGPSRLRRRTTWSR
jgi:hypothetical protein